MSPPEAPEGRAVGSDSQRPNERWFEDGLRFACTGCGDCCRGAGYVWLGEERASRIARHLGLDLEEFGRRFLRRVGGRLALVDGADGACVFWQNGCRIYPARPRQCRTFPFWPEHVESAEAWRRVAGECEGVGSGERYGAAEIVALGAGRGATRPPEK